MFGRARYRLRPGSKATVTDVEGIKQKSHFTKKTKTGSRGQVMILYYCSTSNNDEVLEYYYEGEA